MFKEAVERFHQLDDGDVRAVVDELVVGVGGIGPAPCIGEGMELGPGLLDRSARERERCNRRWS